MVQGELFRDENTGELPKLHEPGFLRKYQLTLTLDKLIIGLIAFVVVFGVVYCFGVEHGKRVMEKKLESLLPVHAQVFEPGVREEHREPVGEPEVIVVVPEIDGAPVGAEEEEGVSSALPIVDPLQGTKFTIQLVTYKKEQHAEDEIVHLKDAGYNGFVIPSGEYLQVCIDYFDSRDKAKSVLRKLQLSGRYPGAYVRPVIR